MERRLAKAVHVLGFAVLAAGLVGCRQSPVEPAGTTAPPASPGTTQSASSEPILGTAAPPIDLTIECPEEVDVGQPFASQIEVANRGQAAMSELMVKTQFDAGLERTSESMSPAADGPVEHEFPALVPGQPKRIELTLRTTEPGTFSYTVEVSQGGQVVASQWTTVTAKGQPIHPPAGQPDEPEVAEADKPDTGPDLGPPLVDNVDSLQKLHPYYPVWFDKAAKSVVMVGLVCQRQAPLELFACLRGSKEHESVVSVATQAYVVHAGLMAAGAEPGTPVKFDPKYVPPSGPEIDVRVIWKDQEGQKRSARAQDWVRNVQTGKAMSSPWVFAGSRFVRNERTGEQRYVADMEGDLICVANFPSAVLDVPVESSDSDAALMFDAFTERIPPRGTPVTLVLTPKRDEGKGIKDEG